MRQIPSSAFWGVSDQAVSSVTNFAIGLFAARSLTVSDFGAFSIVFVTYTVGLGLYRAVAGDPLVVRYADIDSASRREAIAAASGVTLLVSVLAGAICLLSSFAFDDALAGGLRALGISFPGLLMQDMWRFCFFASRRGRAAFLNDVIWAIGLVVGLGLLSAVGNFTTATLIGVWGGAGTLAAVVGAFQVGTRARPGRALRWWRQQRDLAPRFLAEFLAVFGAAQLTLYGIGAVLGLSAVGALRAAWILLGPLNVPLMASVLVGIPEGVRMLRDGTERLRRLSQVISLGLLLLVLAWGGALLLVPQSVGVAVLRGNWSAAQVVLLPLIIAFAGTGASLGPIVGLRALAAARRSLRASSLMSVMTFTLAVGAALTGGLQSAAWTMAVVSWLGAALWWQQYLEAIAEHADEQRNVVSPVRRGVSPE